MKVWRKRIIHFSFRDNPSSPVFAHTLAGDVVIGRLPGPWAGYGRGAGLRRPPYGFHAGPVAPFAGSVLWYCLRRHFGFHVPGVAPLRGPGIQACAARPTAPV